MKLEEVRPLRGNQSKYRPPENNTIRRIAKRKPGTALPNMTMPEVQISNPEPSRTALEIPNGIEIKYHISF